jgi:hypothetical protein
MAKWSTRTSSLRSDSKKINSPSVKNSSALPGSAISVGSGAAGRARTFPPEGCARRTLALGGHTHTLEQIRPGEVFQGWQTTLSGPERRPVPLPPDRHRGRLRILVGGRFRCERGAGILAAQRRPARIPDDPIPGRHVSGHVQGRGHAGRTADVHRSADARVRRDRRLAERQSGFRSLPAGQHHGRHPVIQALRASSGDGRRSTRARP